MITFDEAQVVTPDGNVILHPTSLTLSEQRVSIVGGNGSGKSTIARLINGLIEPHSGSVTLGTPGSRHKGASSHANGLDTGLDTVRDGAAVRRAVGFVFTDPAAQLIMPTVIEDIELSLRREYRNAAQRSAAAFGVLEKFGLAALAERSVHTLSGGQKQLLAIATVLATNPEVLVADEPTTLLDLQNSARIGDLLFSLPQQLIVVTHDLELAARADRTLVVENGRVIVDGDPHTAISHYRASVAT